MKFQTLVILEVFVHLHVYHPRLVFTLNCPVDLRTKANVFFFFIRVTRFAPFTMLKRVTLHASSPSGELLNGRHDILGAQTGRNDSQTSKVDEAV